MEREELQRIIDSLESVDEVLVCVSGCGGSTKNLKATTADIIIPNDNKHDVAVDFLVAKIKDILYSND